jgi:hypothetical protein
LTQSSTEFFETAFPTRPYLLDRLTVTVQMPNVAAEDAAFQFCIDG